MSEKSNEKFDKKKHKIPVMSLDEFRKNEFETEDKKIRGPIIIKKEDTEKAIEYFTKCK